MKHKKILKIDNYKLFLYTLVLFMFFSFFMISYVWSKNYKIITLTNILISKPKILNDAIYKEALGDIEGIDLNLKNLKQITSSLEEHPYVEAVRASYRYPNTLKVEILEREPIAILNSDPIVMLDKNGYVLPNINNQNRFSLPIMSNYNTEMELYPIGKKVLSVKAKQSIEWISLIQNNYPFLYNNLSEIRLQSGENIELILLDEPTKILMGNTRFNDKIEILKEFKINLNPYKRLTDFSYLDMRYKNQVIGKPRSL